jgi:hypothetical protein
VKTDDLVSLLATRVEAVDSSASTRRYVFSVAAGTFVATILTTELLGLRSAFVSYLTVPMFWVREAFCAAIGAVGLVSVARLSHPGRRLGLLLVGLVVPVLAMWSLAVVALLAAEPQARSELIFGQTASVCPFLIAFVSAPLLVAFVWMMRGLAPTRLRLAGAAAGLAAGAIGALVYTLHCPELAAPFLGIWYVLGMLIPTTVGAWLGPHVLRW